MPNANAEMAVDGYTCKDCSFDVWLPIRTLSTSTLGLYDDDRFPGRCILAYRDHVEDLTALDPGRACAFLEDARDAARAILAATGADRMNYAVLGNRDPHLHFHLIPRVPGTDPVPTEAPWKHPDARRPLPTGEVQQLRRSIARHLES